MPSSKPSSYSAQPRDQLETTSCYSHPSEPTQPLFTRRQPVEGLQYARFQQALAYPSPGSPQQQYTSKSQSKVNQDSRFQRTYVPILPSLDNSLTEYDTRPNIHQNPTRLRPNPYARCAVAPVPSSSQQPTVQGEDAKPFADTVAQDWLVVPTPPVQNTNKSKSEPRSSAKARAWEL